MNSSNKIVVGCDHGGYKLKSEILEYLKSFGEVIDIGCFGEESVDFPKIAEAIFAKMQENPNNKSAIAICGSGIGISIAINSLPHMRGALIHPGPYSEELAKLSRQHNDANVLCLGGRFMGAAEARQVIAAFLNTEHLESNPNYKNRMNMIDAMRKNYIK